MKAIIFSLGDKEYGVNISQINEVIRIRKVTAIPDAPRYIEGVITVRGKVVPLINLRVKFGLETTLRTRFDRIVILKLKPGHMAGIIVDSVTSAINIDDSAITPPDDLIKDSHYLIGLARIDKRLILVIDAERFLSGEAAEKIDDIAKRVEVRKPEAL